MALTDGRLRTYYGHRLKGERDAQSRSTTRPKMLYRQYKQCSTSTPWAEEPGPSEHDTPAGAGFDVESPTRVCAQPPDSTHAPSSPAPRFSQLIDRAVTNQSRHASEDGRTTPRPPWATSKILFFKDTLRMATTVFAAHFPLSIQ